MPCGSIKGNKNW